MRNPELARGFFWTFFGFLLGYATLDDHHSMNLVSDLGYRFSIACKALSMVGY